MKKMKKFTSRAKSWLCNSWLQHTINTMAEL